MNDISYHYLHSSLREKVLEHIFIGDLLKSLWRNRIHDIEILRAEVDMGGYDLVVECGGIQRHIQLKSSYDGASSKSVNINMNLLKKPSGCIVWYRFNLERMELGPFLWFGAAPGKPLPDLGEKIAKHTSSKKQDGTKKERPNIRTLQKSKFTRLATMDKVIEALFGNLPIHIRDIT